MENTNQQETENNDNADKERLIEEYLNGWKRAKADLINYKKEEIKRLEDILKFGNENLIRDLTNVLDAFDLAITALEKQGVIEKGIYMIKSQLNDILKKYGLEKLTVSVGQQFDPSVHEAIAETEGQPPNAVVEEIEAGYMLNGKLIKPAKVKVAK